MGINTFILLSLLILQIFSQANFDLVTKIKSRYSQVLFTTENMAYYIGDITPKRNIIVSPYPLTKNTKVFQDLCSNSTYTSLVNPLNYTQNICENYFCSSTPFYLQEKTYSIKNHVALHRFCLQCNNTSDQKFEEILLQKRCTYFDTSFCTNSTCSNRSSCIIYDSRGGLCYVWDEKIYYRLDDYLHNTLFWIMIRYLGFLDFGIYLVLWFLYTFFSLIPEIVFLAQTLDKSVNLCSKFAHFFGLKSQSVYWIFLSLTVCNIALILDLFETSALKLSLVSVVLAIGMIYISYINLIIKWAHILKQAEENVHASISIQSLMILISFYALFIFIGVIGAILVVLHEFLLDYERAFILSLGVYVAILMIIMSVLVLVLSIYSIRMIFVLSNNELDFSKNIFKMNFSKTVLWMNIGSIPLILIKLLSAILFLFGRDAFSIEFWLFYTRILNYIFFFCYIGYSIAYFRGDSLKRTYCCWIKN